MARTLSVVQRLENLRFLLENLPQSLPEPTDSPFQHFVNYSADPEDVELIGSVPGAVNRALELAFGYETRLKGILPITERGRAVCGLVDALELYRQACDKPESDGMLLKWWGDIHAGAELAYKLANKTFPPVGLPHDLHDGDEDSAMSSSGTAGRKRKASAPLEEVISISDDEKVRLLHKHYQGIYCYSLELIVIQDEANSAHSIKLSDLVDIPWHTREVVSAGRPVKEETRAFAIKCRHKEIGKTYWRCLAPQCLFFRSGAPQPKRVLKHAMACRAFSPDQRRSANDFAATYSLGAKLGEVEEAPVIASSSRVVGDKGGGGLHSFGAPPAVPGKADTQLAGLKQRTLSEAVLAAGRQDLKAKLDFFIMKLICVRGLVPNVINSREWKDFVNAANPRYNATSSTTFAKVYIPAEAAKIRILQLQFLRQQTHLTLTYDGATMQKPQSVYTIHITTQNRRVFFMDGAEMSRDAHTAEHVVNILLEVSRFQTIMEAVGIERFSGICSDSAGNTRKARAILAKQIAGLLALPDCCHHLHNTAKDITKLPEFKELIGSLRKIIQYFRKSTKASNDLAAAHLEEGLTRGLQSIGKTRFASVYWSAESLRACLPLMRQLVSSGRLAIPRKQVKFDITLLQENSVASIKFEQELTRYTTILAPIARAIKSLEATDTTAADVYMFWLGIASSLRELFARPQGQSGVSPDLAKKITGIVNKRYKAIIDEAPTDVYFVAFFLDPDYCRADILAKPTSVSNTIFVPPALRDNQNQTEDDDSRKAPNPRAYTHVKEFLKKLLLAEVESNAHPLVKELDEADLADELREQLLAYACGEYPFKQRPDRKNLGARPVLNWWLALSEHSHARTLAMLAIKIYSIAVNSMAEERTMSNFTWFNSKLRSQQQVKTLVDMIQVRQWYPYKDYPQVSPKTHPTVRWIDMDKAIFDQRTDQIQMTQDDEDDFFAEWPWEAQPANGAEDRDSEAGSTVSADKFKLDDLVDLRSSHLRTMLCDQLEEEEGSDDEFFATTRKGTDAASSNAAPRRKANWGW
ncbi:hypothetical protein BN946_scf185016.g73 [Trametes cinnabarina]|uniref:DUF659 domain-containing protein n=1 Tax=Pycnoporus cinnabarinus TaxID=5643 RepID=A0A060SIB6_PYCCI|nr:hypothetical protein BN946_scf185016.g73 [Trametes cinnabarina]